MIYNAPKVFVLFWCCDEASCTVGIVLVSSWCILVSTLLGRLNRDTVLTTWMLHFDSESIE